MDLTKSIVNKANVNRCKLDVSSTHITTGGFMQYLPVYYRHMLPDEHIKGNLNVLSRLAPVAVPTYGRCRINVRSFFVPYSAVWRHFNNFIVDTISSDFSSTSLTHMAPRINNVLFYNMLHAATCSTALDPSDPAQAAMIASGQYDYKEQGSYYVLTLRGRRLYKILVSLGYKVIWDSKTEFWWSALPLMCYAKVYMDYYANSAYLNSVDYNKVNQLFEYNDPSTVLNLTSTHLNAICDVVYNTVYDAGNDVYLAAWDTPFSPNQGLDSGSFGFTDYGMSGSYRSGVANDEPLLYSQPYMEAQNIGNVGTYFTHQALKSLTDFVKRNQLSGGYAYSRFLARFGVDISNSGSRKSIYVNGQSIDINFGDVMQTVNTASAGDPSNLGDYSGKGAGNGTLSFDFTAPEFGMFLIAYSIQPTAHFVQGYDRANRRIVKSQFFQNEFDNLGCDSIEKGEVYVSKHGDFASANDYTGIYGFAPRYYDYKQKSDFLSGDFMYPAIMAGGDSWHLYRLFNDNTFETDPDKLTHSFAIMNGEDSVQYNRIFQNTDKEYDNFYLVFHVAAQALSPCKSLFDTYEFDEEGEQIALNSNGAKVN